MHDKNSSLSTGYLAASVEDDVLVIRLDRPDKLNALTHDMLADLVSIIDSVGDRGVRGIILTGEGRAFSAGHDLSHDNQITDLDEIGAAAETFHEVSRACLRTNVPTIALINGLAVGGAFEMTLAFDRRIGTADAEVYMPENSLGLIISNASSYLLSRLIGPSAALDFILASRRIDATDALQLGLIDEIVEADPLQTAIERIHQYNTGSSSVTQHLSLLRPSEKEIADAMDNETAAAKDAWNTGVTQSGIRKFWESRS